MAQHISAEKESDKVSPQHTTRPAITGRTPRPLATLQNIANRSMAVQRVSALQDMANARYTSTQLISEEEADVRQDKAAQDFAPVQRRETSQGSNGLPPGLKSGIENLSGISMADVTVQRNSSEPAKVGAHAFAQGTNIHLGPGQDKHLPHEAWHVVQQKQGRVKPTLQMKGVAINDDAGLEREADIMGAKANQKLENFAVQSQPSSPRVSNYKETLQAAFIYRALIRRIIEDRKPDEYYRKLGFLPLPTTDGRTIWCDPRNVDVTREALLGEGVDIALPEEPLPHYYAEDAQRSGTNVEQDGHRELNEVDQEYYYIGTGIGWTTRIRTCTALAINDHVTGMSFLCHADGNENNLSNILEHLDRYLLMVPDQCHGVTLTINVFTAEHTLKNPNNTSLEVVLQALVKAKLQCDNITRVNPDDTVAVFPGGPARRLEPTPVLLRKALESLCEIDDGEKQDYILKVFRDVPSALEEDEVYDGLWICCRVMKEEGRDPHLLSNYLGDEHYDQLQDISSRPAISPSPPSGSSNESLETSSSEAELIGNWADYMDEHDPINADFSN